MEGWFDFFVVTGGAAAALAGLLFVSVSINLQQIVHLAHLPGRAIEALVVLLSALSVAICGAAPHQPVWAFGAEMVGVCLVATAIITRVQVKAGKHYWWWVVRRVLRNQLPILSFGVAGVWLLVGHPTGVYWVVPGMVWSLVAGVVSAWSLLVDVHRGT